MMVGYIDGSSIGNPGRAGIGYLIYKDNKLIHKESVYLGIQSNNFAEYMGLIFVLSDIIARGEKSCQIYSDSKLICEQINGNYKVKHQNILPLYVLAKKIISKLNTFKINHILRDKNKEADKLARKATGFLTR
ncbi:MAG: ribonuclease HI family protein [Candidatus Omnitrophica bacterium]|nr:ribonuclease HI family protein [Candidatus Omnitrophota bacterium]MCF7892079.1 ribonuclease HI family protein [Candidatus Omnitrophota bacterium]MCF7895887.1 ribonuclease HI family protein [Candidatus Omnitrophota bacterium]MCF7897821.1 ribonuclease HI family protein [Candidatus Omnitrophota bacterium]MCF7910026.1 ribonuclease HI family protein [Candidatus Omnitrophota bacterium]